MGHAYFRVIGIAMWRSTKVKACKHNRHTRSCLVDDPTNIQGSATNVQQEMFFAIDGYKRCRHELTRSRKPTHHIVGTALLHCDQCIAFSLSQFVAHCHLFSL